MLIYLKIVTFLWFLKIDSGILCEKSTEPSAGKGNLIFTQIVREKNMKQIETLNSRSVNFKQILDFPPR